MDLKDELRNINNMSRDQILNQDIEGILNKMLDNIGAIDLELRDKLIYKNFIRLISENYLSKLQLQYVIEITLDNYHLFYRIGEKNTDSVFTRSFSSLVIGAVLDKDKNERFLSSNVLSKAFKSSNSYLRLEKDTRGYVEGKGWAHSIAHGADLLVSVINHPNFEIEQSNDYLETIQNCLFKGTVFIDDEDERLISIIGSLIDKNLAETKLIDWITKVFYQLDLLFEKEGYSLNFFWNKTNVMNFVKTLYFRLGDKNKDYKLKNCIEEYIKLWNKRLSC